MKSQRYGLAFIVSWLVERRRRFDRKNREWITL